MIARALLLVLGVVGLIGHSIAPETVQLDAEGLTLLGILVLVALAPVLKDFSLPLGGGATFVDGVNAAAAALKRSESDRTEEIRDAPAADDRQVSGPDQLSDVEQMAAVAPKEAVIALRREMSDRLRQLDRALVGGASPRSDYEVVRRLVKGGIVDQELAVAAYAVLGATEEGAREREVPVAAVRELIAIADRLLRDLAASANPALRFESDVGDALRELAGRDRVVRDPSRTADFRVLNTLVEAKYVRPGRPATAVIISTARRLEEQLETGVGALVVVNDDAHLRTDEVNGIRIIRLKDLQRQDLHLP